MRCSTSSSCTWKALVSAGTTTILPPLAVMKGVFREEWGNDHDLAVSVHHQGLDNGDKGRGRHRLKQLAAADIQTKAAGEISGNSCRGSSKPGAME